MRIKGKHYRTIWVSPEDRETVQIIDQRHLPHHFVVENLRTVDEVAAAIREMHVRGAGLIGATAGFGMYLAVLEAKPNDFEESVRASARKLIQTRPTARNLAWAVERQLAVLFGEGTGSGLRVSRDKALATSFAEAQRIADEDADFCRRIGEHGLEIIRDLSLKKNGEPVNVLTHCNAGWLAFVDYGTATSPVYAAQSAGIKVHVWVDETRPWIQGAKLTAWELGQEGVPHTLIADNTGGHLMQHGQVDLVIVGTDRTTRSGDVANKIGTYLKALAARDCGVPFYVALPSSTFDWSIRDGMKEIPIEERSGDEVKRISGKTVSGSIETVLISPEDTPAANYGFDVTPARLIDGLITERGIVRPNEEAILGLYPEYR